MDANVTQSWLMARASARQMLKQGRGGKIVLMSSARGLLGHPAALGVELAEQFLSALRARRGHLGA